MYTTPTRIKQTNYMNQSPLNDSFSNLSQAVPKIIWDNKTHSPLYKHIDKSNLQENNNDDIDEILKIFDKHKDTMSSQVEIFTTPLAYNNCKESYNTYAKKSYKGKKCKLFKLKEQAELLLKEKKHIKIENHSSKQLQQTIPKPYIWNELTEDDEDPDFFSDAEIISTLTQISDKLYDERSHKFKTPPHNVSLNLIKQKSSAKSSEDILCNKTTSTSFTIQLTSSPNFNSKPNTFTNNPNSKLDSLNKSCHSQAIFPSQSPIIPLFRPTSTPNFFIERQPLSLIDLNRANSKCNSTLGKNNDRIEYENCRSNLKLQPLKRAQDYKYEGRSKHPSVQNQMFNLNYDQGMGRYNANSNQIQTSSTTSTPKGGLEKVDKIDDTYTNFISEDIIQALTQDDDDDFFI